MLLEVPMVDIALATAELDAAKANGFIASEALFRAVACDTYGNLTLKFDGLIMKAHQTDKSKNWGNSGSTSSRLSHIPPFYRTHKYVDGRLEEIE